MHYKLDLGIDHVLIDEAQDTSPKQWEIVKALVARVLRRRGARDNVKRTIFAVGDEKQSIFSFQGAAPREFDADAARFPAACMRGAGCSSSRPSSSTRSVPAQNVLGAVDTGVQAAGGMRFERAPIEATGASRRCPTRRPGLVEIWAADRADERKEIEGWDAPFDTAERRPAARGEAGARASPRDVGAVATRRAGISPATCSSWCASAARCSRPIIRALKNAGIPVAGADRLVLTEHIAVMDLMALADALLLPDDDLALATVLKSPLFGLDEEQLFELAWNRKGIAARRAARQGGGDPTFAAADALDELARRRAQADAVRVLCASCSAPAAARQKFLARLGPEANDALDEFLNLALDYERARDAVAAGLRRLAARRRSRGEARHGDGARRGAGDDRARRQGP